MTSTGLMGNLPPMFLDAAAATQSKAELMLNTTLTGLIVVFAVLILLIFIIMIFSKVTLALSKKSDDGNEPKAQKKETVTKAQTAPKAAAASQPAAPAVQNQGVSGDIIAVIAAAVAATDPSLKITSVRRAAPAQKNTYGRRKAWSNAGIWENTRPF